MEAISKHISFKEATQSPTATKLGIVNVPNEKELQCMKEVAKLVFEPLREWYNKPIKINSFFRCEKLNKAVGGAKTSQHRFGEAIDISAGSKEENKKLFDWIVKNLEFDQVINEHNYTWVHVSYRINKNRKQILEIK
jgi:zinc D-Ala-D-Ala carboxypeptidase